MVAEKIELLDVMERDLRRVMELKPDNAHAYNALGYSLADRNVRLQEALELVQTAYRLRLEMPSSRTARLGAVPAGTYRRGA